MTNSSNLNLYLCSVLKDCWHRQGDIFIWVPCPFWALRCAFETSKKEPKMSHEMAEVPWKCCRLYCMVFLDLERKHCMVWLVTFPRCFFTCFGVIGHFGYLNVVKLGVSCNLAIFSIFKKYCGQMWISEHWLSWNHACEFCYHA